MKSQLFYFNFTVYYRNYFYRYILIIILYNFKIYVVFYQDISDCMFEIYFLFFYRWGSKRIVLDCTTLMAKKIVVSHVKDIQLGKRTYHYLLSGLVIIN